jgi:hypothetical protein
MIKTQHCPNCEATEQKLHDFRQEVSDEIQSQPPAVRDYLGHFIIPAPKPDPLVEVMEKLGWYNAPTDADDLRAALDALGYEIREKNDG